MGKRAGSVQNPEFVTTGGVKLTLRPVKKLIADRFLVDWEKANIAPKPPLVKLENGEPWPDRNEETFAMDYASWVKRRNYAYIDFILEMGVATEPPKNWVSNYPFEDASNRKVLWIYDILGDNFEDDDNEYNALAEAILSLNQPTQKGVEEAAKN